MGNLPNEIHVLGRRLYRQGYINVYPGVIRKLEGEFSIEALRNFRANLRKSILRTIPLFTINCIHWSEKSVLFILNGRECSKVKNPHIKIHENSLSFLLPYLEGLKEGQKKTLFQKTEKGDKKSSKNINSTVANKNFTFNYSFDGPYNIIGITCNKVIPKVTVFNGINFPCCGRNLNATDEEETSCFFHFDKNILNLELYCEKCSISYEFEVYYSGIKLIGSEEE